MLLKKHFSTFQGFKPLKGRVARLFLSILISDTDKIKIYSD